MTGDVDARSKLRELLGKFSNAMLVTHRTGAGALHARPMAIAAVEEDCTVWFFTARSSPKVAELALDGDVEVLCQDGARFVALCGKARLVEDRAKIDALWKKVYEVWFPLGKQDPELCLVAIRPTEGEYWDQHGAKGLRYVLESAKAWVEGRRPTTDAEQHARTPL